MDRKKISGLSKNFTLTLVTAVLTFLLIEITMRYIAPQREVFYKSDKLLGARLIPNKSGIWNTEGHVTYVKVNEFGFRGWNYQLVKPPNTFRVAIIGDSYVEALQVDEDKMFSNTLERLLNDENEKIDYEVLPFGVSGYGTAQEYLMYVSDVKRFRPDLVIFAFVSANDIRNNLYSLEQDERFPYFVLNRKGELVMNPPLLRNSLVKKLKNVLRNHSHLYRFLSDKGGKLPWYRDRLEIDRIPRDHFVYSCDYSAPWNDSWEITKKIILKLKNEVESGGSKFLLLHISSYAQTHGDDGLKMILDYYPPMKGRCWDLEKPNKILEIFSLENQILYLDLLPIMKKDYAQSKQETHFIKDGHWNERGHNVAAQALERFLKENKLGGRQ